MVVLEQFYMGNKNDLLKFFKSMFIVALLLAIVGIGLVKILSLYYEMYVYREEARVIYDLQLPSNLN